MDYMKLMYISRRRYTRILDSHAGNMGSYPLGSANFPATLSELPPAVATCPLSSTRLMENALRNGRAAGRPERSAMVQFVTRPGSTRRGRGMLESPLNLDWHE